ncbi:RNA polymerase III transcription factor IIIC subunit-domain-containing protein [Dipodascopsis tothii]|uniref:RNA polymerase III transcription factor IIIC subunit-domain-containing protein n=1 Tax=Dipodascopsis tothii TaxID=44089 RepID=UPI0034CEFE96
MAELVHVSCVEYPARVQNTARALATLGSRAQVAKAIHPQSESPLELRFRPEDPFCHPVVARSVTNAHGVLLKIKVKKAHLAANGGDLRRTMAAHPDAYSARPCAVIDHFLRFREIADYQYNTANSPFVQRQRAAIYSGDLDVIKTLELSGGGGGEDLDMPPPPRFSRVVVPLDYAYRQNPAVTAVTDPNGTTRLVNKNLAKRLFSKVMHWTDAAVPETYHVSKLPVPKEGSELAEIVAALRELFEARPIWTKRALVAHLPPRLKELGMNHVKFALPYVAFTWKSGPYRATYTRYGVDPRTDARYAEYQIEFFRFSPDEEREADSSPLRNERAQPPVPDHVFDGVHLPPHRSFQLCDLRDPVLCDLLASGGRRDVCDVMDGWIKATTMSKIRRIIKMKLKALLAGHEPAVLDVAKVLDEPSDDEMAEAPAAPVPDEQSILKQVSAVSSDGGEKLKELLGLLHQQDEHDGTWRGGALTADGSDIDEYEIYEGEDE